MNLTEQINAHLKEAMKARDSVRLDTLRNIKKMIIEVGTAPGKNRQVDDDEVISIIQKLAKQGRESAKIFAEQNRSDLAEKENAQVTVMEQYLPKALSEDEIEAQVKAVIKEVGATDMKDMGRVMGMAAKKMVGRADGEIILQIVKKLLS